jgi:endogenous inhibitor of DNA gyrase (YacG/DUF329 family)
MVEVNRKVVYNKSMDIPIYTCLMCGKKVARKNQAKPVKIHFCSMGCKANYQRQAKPVSKEWLEQKYLIEKLDCTKIGKLVSRDSKSVWNWLKDFGIPTRKRGTTGNGARGRPAGFKQSEETKKKLREIALADGRVPYKKEIGSYMKNRKGKDTPGWKGGITPERQELYARKEWKEVWYSVMNRDKKTCQRCGKKYKKGIRLDVHHIRSFKVISERMELSNLIVLCYECHKWVHSNKNINKDYIRED